jgi:hypothetical protein
MQSRYELRPDRLRNRVAGILASQLADKPLTQFQELQEAVIHFERAVI